MKSTFAALLVPILAAIAAAAVPLEFETGQAYLDEFGSLRHEGYDFDLQELRLVEFEGQPPRWITELDKVHFKILAFNT